MKEKLSSEVRGRLKLLLFKQQAVHSADVGDIQNPPITRILEHQFRLNFFRRQLAYPVRLLSPSLHVKRRFEHAGFREVQHLPLGFHTTEKITGLPFDRKLKIAFLGNLIVNKGAAVILRELPAIARSGRIEIHIHGRPYDMLYVEELKKLSLQFPEDTVFFHGGYRSDRELKEILSNVHLVVFPSIWEENYPLVVRESLLLGVPVIGSKLGGVPEAVEDSVNGFLFDPYREGDLAEKISRILDNPGILSVITEGAKKTRIESMEGHLDKIVKVYEEALGCS